MTASAGQSGRWALAGLPPPAYPGLASAPPPRASLDFNPRMMDGSRVTASTDRLPPPAYTRMASAPSARVSLDFNPRMMDGSRVTASPPKLPQRPSASGGHAVHSQAPSSGLHRKQRLHEPPASAGGPSLGEVAVSKYGGLKGLADQVAKTKAQRGSSGASGWLGAAVAVVDERRKSRSSSKKMWQALDRQDEALLRQNINNSRYAQNLQPMAPSGPGTRPRPLPAYRPTAQEARLGPMASQHEERSPVAAAMEVDRPKRG